MATIRTRSFGQRLDHNQLGYEYAAVVESESNLYRVVLNVGLYPNGSAATVHVLHPSGWLILLDVPGDAGWWWDINDTPDTFKKIQDAQEAALEFVRDARRAFNPRPGDTYPDLNPED